MKFTAARKTQPPLGGRALRSALLLFVVILLSAWTYIIMASLSAQSPPRGEPTKIGVTNTHNEVVRHHHLSREDRPMRQLLEPISNHNLNQTTPVTSFIYPLHAKSGTHHAYLYAGTPPQRQTLIVDTGSRLTAFPCQPHCPNCGSHASNQYHLNASSSYEVVPCDKCKLSETDFPIEEYLAGDRVGGNSGDGPSLRGAAYNQHITKRNQRNLLPNSCENNQCMINQRYTEGSSWIAFEVLDAVWLGLDDIQQSVDTHAKYATPFVFGCQTSEQGLFRTQYADGIMGLSMYTQTLVGTWYEKGVILHESFSLCLNSKGGHISIGGTPDRDKQSITAGSSSTGRLLSPMKFTQFSREHVWYYTVSVTNIKVGQHVLPKSILKYVNDHKGTIVDSGTTDTFITHRVAKPFISAWQRITRREYNNRLQSYTYEEFRKLPIITFELDGGINWEITPESYMENANSNDDTANTTQTDTVPWEGKRGFTSRIYVDEPQGVVLGSNAMMDKEIYFDIANRRLGVANAICEY